MFIGEVSAACGNLPLTDVPGEQHVDVTRRLQLVEVARVVENLVAVLVELIQDAWEFFVKTRPFFNWVAQLLEVSKLLRQLE